MKIFNSVIGLTTLALCALGVTAAPTPADRHDDPKPPHANVTKTTHGGPKPTETVVPGTCKPEYTINRYSLDFEDISPFCLFGPCLGLSIFNITTPRGQGTAYQKGLMERPLLIPNIAGWAGINCSWEGFNGKDEKYACGNNSVKALYSPGKSPWDATLKPRLNTVDFPDTYIRGAIESLYVTPIRLPNGTHTASFELVGTKVDGTTVKYAASLNIASGVKRFLVSGLVAKGFTEITALDLWLVAGGKGGYEFALDDLVLDEYRPKPLPKVCYPPTTTSVDHGPCTPKPIRTTTWTADAEDLSPTADVVGTYKDVNWYGSVTVEDNDSLDYFWPPSVVTDSGKNFFKDYSPLTLFAEEQQQRFGVDSFSIACGYANDEPDYSQLNNKPCDIFIMGRRDPYDGDGLPQYVTLNYTIPHPGNVTSQRFTKIDLNKLSDSPGKFSRLYEFSVHASQTSSIGYVSPTDFLVDNIVFFKGVTPDDPKCRMPGVQTLDFDDIKVGTALEPVGTYKGFSFSRSWAAVSKKNYAPGTPGYKSVKSGQNSLFSGLLGPEGEYYGTDIYSYQNPKDNFLFNFEEVTITLDLPEDLDPARIPEIALSISVLDACGGGSANYLYIDRNPIFYYKTIRPGKFQITVAEPIIGISRINFYASFFGGDYETINFFIDDFKYRKFEGPTPGCWRCGFRGGDWCEVPAIKGR